MAMFGKDGSWRRCLWTREEGRQVRAEVVWLMSPGRSGSASDEEGVRHDTGKPVCALDGGEVEGLFGADNVAEL